MTSCVSPAVRHALCYYVRLHIVAVLLLLRSADEAEIREESSGRPKAEAAKEEGKPATVSASPRTKRDNMM